MSKRYVEIVGNRRIAYGWDHAVGVFVQVFDDDDDEPTVDDDALFDGICVADVIATAQAYGALLVGARMLAAPAAFRLVRRESGK